MSKEIFENSATDCEFKKNWNRYRNRNISEIEVMCFDNSSKGENGYDSDNNQ